MPVLQIRDVSGLRKTRTLSKDQPLAVGRHSSNDIQVDEDGVATLHCRISWAGKNFQIASANSTGVVVNNQLTFRADLEEGDVIRVGSLELTFRDNVNAGDVDEIPLEDSTQERTVKSSPGKQPKSNTPPKGSKLTEKSPDLAKDAPLTGEIVIEEPAPPSPRKKTHSPNPAVDSLESILAGMAKSPNEQQGVPLPRQKREEKSFFSSKPIRPGERELTRSPLVLILGAGLLVLSLVAFTLLFLVERESADQAYNRGLEELKQKRFSVSIERFQEFVETFPKHLQVNSAVAYSNLAKAEQTLAGSTPDWKRALAQLEQYVRSIRDLSNFSEMQVFSRDVALRIALGAAEAAAALKNRELIETSSNAARVLEGNSPPDQRPAETLKRISDAQVKAGQAIRRFEFISDSLGKIGSLLDKNDTLAALEDYQKLIDEYPDASSEAQVASLFGKIFFVDKSLVKTRELRIEASTSDEIDALPQVIPIRATRSRADLVDSGATVCAIVGSACYGVDSGTGAVRWRRTVGNHLPFAPVPVTNDVSCVLLFDTRSGELILLQQRDGKLVWKLPLKERIRGNPIVHEGRILCLVEPSALIQVELNTGNCTKRVDFPQPVVGSPVLFDRHNQIAVAGNRQFTYLLDARSLDCKASIQSGQRENGIQSSPITLGPYVMLPEIDRTDSTKLSVWDFSVPDSAKLAAAVRLPGHVRDQAVLRGKLLFVPSSGERVTSFIVSDQAGTPLLTRSAGYQVPNGGESPTFLIPGPEDELWMGSSVVQRLELSVDSIVPSGGQISIGSTTQPLQIVDRDLVIVGHPKGVRSFVIIGAESQEMSGRWQIQFGSNNASPMADSSQDNKFSILTDSGDLFEIDPAAFDGKAVRDIRPVASLPDRPEGYGDIRTAALSTKALFVAAGLPEPHWWLMHPAGQIINEGKLQDSLQAEPLPFAGGVVLPVKGKLMFLDPANPKRRVENFILPQGDRPADPWVDLQIGDENHFVAVGRSGRLARFQLRAEPAPHLFEVSHVDRDTVADFPLDSEGDLVYTAAGTLLECWNSTSWERIWNADLAGKVSGKPRRVGELVLVETGGDTLHAVRRSDGSNLWKTEIDSPVAGEILVWNSQLTIPLASGTVLFLPPEGDPQSIRRWNCGRNLSGTPIVLGQSLFLSGDDGSWIRVDSLPGESK